MKYSAILLLLIPLLWLGCAEKDSVSEKIAAIPVEIRVERFDREFSDARPADLPALKNKFPFLFPANYPDSVWIAKMQDSLQMVLHTEVREAFEDFGEVENSLRRFYQHVLYYFPGQHVPRIIAVTSDVDYRNRIILTDTLLLIGLDNYLGKDHRFYEGIDRYIAEGLDRQYLISDVAGAFAKKVVVPPQQRTFLARMLYYGKELYLKERLIPFVSDAQKMGYTEDELAWARANEEQIWRYFIERELLYSTDNQLDARFLDPAPFSKFRLELIDGESPGRVGRYIGWQIVRAFMDRNNISLQQLLQLPADQIFQQANYKPKK